MKTIITIFFISAVSFVSAQKGGEIQYKITVNLHKFMTGEYEQYKAMMPEFKKSKMKLLFNGNVSLFENMPIEVESAEHGGWGSYVPDNKYYLNSKTKTVTKKVEMMSKSFLITDTLKKQNWKITGRTKLILGMPCISAEFSDTTTTYTAWFTPKLPYPIGPNDFGQLPGVILEVCNSDTSMHVMAAAFNPKELEDKEIEMPSKGKAMTGDEFNAMIEERMKEYEEETGKKLNIGYMRH